jgi:hypothetical protein
MVNAFRNEYLAILNEREYLLRASFGALVEIEAAAGCAIPKIVEQIGEQNLSLRVGKAVIVAGIKGAGEKVNEAQLEEDIANAGIAALNHVVLGFLLVSTFGGEKIKKN